MPSLKSDALRFVEYDNQDSTLFFWNRRGDLFVTFQDGAEYIYSFVPRRVYDKLLKAASIGGFFNASVRKRYNYRRVK